MEPVYDPMNETPIRCSAVPEPSAFGMVLIGALGLLGLRRSA